MILPTIIDAVDQGGWFEDWAVQLPDGSWWEGFDASTYAEQEN